MQNEQTCISSTSASLVHNKRAPSWMSHPGFFQRCYYIQEQSAILLTYFLLCDGAHLHIRSSVVIGWYFQGSAIFALTMQIRSTLQVRPPTRSQTIYQEIHSGHEVVGSLKSQGGATLPIKTYTVSEHHTRNTTSISLSMLYSRVKTISKHVQQSKSSLKTRLTSSTFSREMTYWVCSNQ